MAVHPPYTPDMKTITLIAAIGTICLLSACGDDGGSRTTKVQPKPAPTAAEKVPGPDDAFNDKRKLGSTSDPKADPDKGSKKKKKSD